MKPSALHKGVFLLTTLALTSSACSFLRVPNDVGVKPVSVNLVFGDSEQQRFTPPPPPALPPAAVIDFELPPAPPVKPPKPKPPLCGPTTAIAPRDSAPASIGAGNQPTEGAYLFRFSGNREGQTPFIGIASKLVGNVQPSGAGFTYSVEDQFTRVKTFFEAQPIDDSNPVQDGLFLTRIELPEDDNPLGRTLAFEPATPLRLMDFPIQSGATISGQAIDVAPKATTPITDPITGQPLLSPSGNAITSSMTIGARERFEACEELAQAWKVNWDLKITGEYNVEILGAFWMATQYGGWPIREDYVVAGDLMAGNWTSSIMKIDPGDYL